jgi:hypothetical protein
MSKSTTALATPVSNFVAATVAPVAQKSYASQMNAYYNTTANNCISLNARFTTTIAAMPAQGSQWVQHLLQSAVAEFVRMNPTVKTWNDLTLAQSVYVNLADIYIDTTMQRQLDLHWVCKLLAKFKSTKVVPIQVYRDAGGKLCAWDGQHTAMLMWLICTRALNLDPAKVQVPVNIYPSSKKNEIRECFLDLNSSEGKKSLELIDHWIQQVFGVRIDGSTNPTWKLVEQKQTILEKHDLFVTNDKFNNCHMPGAISRLQEINKLDVQGVEWLAAYLKIVTAGNRPAVEKEVMMMAHFFTRCRIEGIKVTDAYIKELAAVSTMLWNADYSPNGPFWAQVTTAYHAWHDNNAANSVTTARVSKEPIHGFPFLIAQLGKSMPGRQVPRNNSNSNFWPAAADLF